jgi:diguanylate cyclase (GGDEF)-like protein
MDFMLVSGAQSRDVPNLATLPASRNDRRAAAAVTFLLWAFAVGAIPARDVVTAPIPGVVPTQEALVFAAYLFTAYLMFSQFRSTGLLVLGTTGVGYLFVSLLQIPYALAYGDLWVRGVLVGTPSTPSWSGLAWHFAFPLLVGIYVAYDRTFSVAVAEEHRGWMIRVAVVTTILVAALVTMLTLAPDVLPALYSGGDFLRLSGIFHVHAPFKFLAIFGGFTLVVNLVAAVMIFMRTRCRTVLQLWITVSLVGMVLDQLLYVISPTHNALTWYLGKAVTLVTASIVLAILLRQVAVLYRRVAELATIDQLTGLPNRRTLEGQLDWMLHYGERNRLALAVVMVDVDYFKPYNDAYGHTSGDDVLKHVANTLRASILRSSDFVARFGGEEFVALLPDTTREGTCLAVERMRTAIERLAIPHKTSPRGKVTISVGAAVGLLSEAGPRELLRAADEALYTAKAGGRNRCVIVSCEPEPSAVRRMSILT